MTNLQFNALLEIFTNQCNNCENTWTSSNVLVKFGSGYTVNLSTSIAQQITEEPNLIEGIQHYKTTHPVCFRCIPVGLEPGWCLPSRDTILPTNFKEKPKTQIRNQDRVKLSSEVIKYKLLED